MMAWVTELDFIILDWIQMHLRCAVLDTFFSSVTHLADGGIIWILLAICLLLWKKTRWLGLALACSLVLDALLCNGLLKPLVARIRPYDLRPAAGLPLIAPPTDFSFPSGHTAVSFAAVTGLTCSHARQWGWSLLVAGMIALSRLYLYVHYPSDVLGGMLAGILAGWLGANLMKKLQNIRHRQGK